MLGRLEDLSIRVLRFNPCVLQHELRLRMRGRSVFVLMLIFAALCSVAAAAPFVFWTLQSAAGGYQESRAEIGRWGSAVLGIVLLTLTLLALPAWAASSISGERERDTLAVLSSTRLSAADGASGKFSATVTYAVLLRAISLPVAAWCMLLGAGSPGELVVVYAILLSFSLGSAGIGLWMSALARTTIGATVNSYVVLFGVFGLPLLSVPLEYELQGVTWDIIGVAFMALVWIGPVAISAWAVAAFARWLITRTGRMRDERARAVFVVVCFGLAALGLFAIEAASGIFSDDLADTALINPYASLVLYLEEDEAPWAAIWASGAAAIAGCLGAVRCLRLREFHPIYVDDIFISAWRRVHGRQAASAGSSGAGAT